MSPKPLLMIYMPFGKIVHQVVKHAQAQIRLHRRQVGLDWDGSFVSLYPNYHIVSSFNTVVMHQRRVVG